MASLISTEGVICRTVKYGDTSLILDIYSPDLGLRTYIINGVRSPRAKSTASILQVINLVRFVCYDNGDSSKISRIKEIQLAQIFKRLTVDVGRSAVAMVMLEISRNILRVSDDNEAVYQYIRDQLLRLDVVEGSVKHIHIEFLIGLAERLGLGMMDTYGEERPYFDMTEGRFVSMPADLRYAFNRGGSALLASYLRKVPVSVSRQERKELFDYLLDFYRYHIPDFAALKTLTVLYAIWEE